MRPNTSDAGDGFLRRCTSYMSTLIGFQVSGSWCSLWGKNTEAERQLSLFIRHVWEFLQWLKKPPVFFFYSDISNVYTRVSEMQTNQKNGHDWKHRQTDRITPHAWNLGQGEAAASLRLSPMFPSCFIQCGTMGPGAERCVSKTLFWTYRSLSQRSGQCRTAAVAAVTAMTSFVLLQLPLKKKMK